MSNPSSEIPKNKSDIYFCSICGEKIIYFMEVKGKEKKSFCKECYKKYYGKV
jgi:formylmethanofuran dehydrogenase subunit E